MATFMFIIAFLWCVQVLVVISADIGPCEQGEFWDDVTSRCARCSTCQINHIVRRPCTRRTDTECGPFYEFDFLKLSGVVDDQAPNDPGGKDRSASRHDEGVLARLHQDSEKEKSLEKTLPTQGPSSRGDDTRWRELCFGLIGAIAAVTLFALVYVIVTQSRGHRTRCKDCEATTDYQRSDAQGSPSYYHSRVSPRGDVMLVHPDVLHLETRLQHNHARHLAANDYVHDVSGYSGSTRHIQLQAIPEQEVVAEPEVDDNNSSPSTSLLLSSTSHVVPSGGHVASEMSLYRSQDDPEFVRVHSQYVNPDRVSL